MCFPLVLADAGGRLGFGQRLSVAELSETRGGLFCGVRLRWSLALLRLAIAGVSKRPTKGLVASWIDSQVIVIFLAATAVKVSSS